MTSVALGRAAVLGIESSCDETAAAVVRDGRVVLSSVVASQHEIHEEYAGVVPELASRAHVERILPVIRRALAEAGVGLGMIDAIAVGNRPGLIGSLLVGVSAAKALAWALDKPLIGVDHVHAHLYSGALVRADDDRPVEPSSLPTLALPALGLVVSGGHTSMYLVRSWTNLARLGSTIDDALGEAYDKGAKILGLPYPGGPELDRLARSANANDRAFDMPISRLSPESLDFSFSGLKTALLYAVRGVPGKNAEHPSIPVPREQFPDLAASFQRAACKAVILKLERALARVRSEGNAVSTLVAGGGVTANSRLRAELAAFAKAHALTLHIPPMEFCVDNAAMIAGLGATLLASGESSGLDLKAIPTTSAT
ncbi:MAG: tRNA (adenosine(37)-N6)-threonylcarbamoyltransferase complex transferase subunit TsaD [Phycisphaerales bacterium]|nr:MAG: tRNA (adenosine(37)-N6)-threonylcarbamoyltransferase complex transferase subunit TsaD [Phycisphaerales bacterium]